jgi:hypothetical protein
MAHFGQGLERSHGCPDTGGLLNNASERLAGEYLFEAGKQEQARHPARVRHEKPLDKWQHSNITEMCPDGPNTTYANYSNRNRFCAQDYYRCPIGVYTNDYCAKELIGF